MKRYDNVQGVVEIDNQIHTVTVLDYDGDKYCTILLPNGKTEYVKRYSIYNLPQGFNFNYLPEDYLTTPRISNKEIAVKLRLLKRYHYKRFNKLPVNIKVKFYNSSEFNFSNLKTEITGTRKQILKYFHSLDKNSVNNFSVYLDFQYKSGSTFGSCFTYKDGKCVHYDFRNKRENKFIKQLLRSLFCVQV